jgi:hypothetical protein
MAVVNIRDFPEELHREAKAQAALEGDSLKGIIIRALTEYLEKKGRVSKEKIKTMQLVVRKALVEKGSKKGG